MKRLILLAHGSSKPAWRAPFDALCVTLQGHAGAEHVRLAFLSSCGPDLPTVAAEAAADGIDTLQILPLFMSGGGHVLRDLRPLSDEIGLRWPDLQVELLPAVGEHPKVVAAMAAIAMECAGAHD